MTTAAFPTNIDLTGRVAVVTGGANGIGLASARRFADAGAHLVLADLNPDALAAAATALEVDGRRVETVVFDARSDDDHDTLVRTATELGDVGVVMLNAGISSGGALESVPLDQWRDLFDVNVFGVVRGLNAFTPTLIEQAKRSHIVITGSSASFFPTTHGVDAPYSASKHALVGVTRAYRNYLARHEVGVQLLAPRMTDTAFPRSSVAWNRDGSSFVTADRDIGPSDTVDDVADTLVAHIGSDRSIIALDPATIHQLTRLATDDIHVADNGELFDRQ